MRATALALGFILLPLGMLACGDDSDGEDAGEAGSAGTSNTGGMGGSGGRMDLPGVDAGDGDGDGDASTGNGDGPEGAPCSTSDDCTSDLNCVFSGFNFGICARSCTTDGDCGDEVCASYSGLAVDAHCINVIRDEYEYCGVADTSNCSTSLNLECLYLPNLPIGVCVHFCQSGTDDDGGVAPVADGGIGSSLCGDTQTCIANIVEAGEDGIDGICGDYVDRGMPCGIQLGAFCDGPDICGSAAPDDMDSEDYRCFQDCTLGEDCDEGTTCTPFRDYAYCL